MKRSALIVALVALVFELLAPARGTGVAAQNLEMARDIRVVEVTTDPPEPVFGEVFALHVTVRAARARNVRLADTLASTYALRSAGPGRWETADAPGDSVEIRGTYPVLPLRDGTDQLPGLLVLPGSDDTDDDGDPALPRWAALGRVDVRPMAELTSGERALELEPPADVAGGAWSPWVLLAAGAMGLGLVGTGASVLARRRDDPSPPQTDRAGPTVMTRDEALRRLEAIRTNGAHREGEPDLFYRSSTDVLRRFLEAREAGWGPPLTSTEILERAADRWGEAAVEDLRPVVRVAEGAKFGARRPGPEAAEEDWRRLRDWIASTPEVAG